MTGAERGDIRAQVLRDIACEAERRGFAAVVITDSMNPPRRHCMRTCLFIHVPVRGEPYEVTEGLHEVLATLRAEAPPRVTKPRRRRSALEIELQLAFDLFSE